MPPPLPPAPVRDVWQRIDDDFQAATGILQWHRAASLIRISVVECEGGKRRALKRAVTQQPSGSMLDCFVGEGEGSEERQLMVLITDPVILGQVGAFKL